MRYLALAIPLCLAGYATYAEDPAEAASPVDQDVVAILDRLQARSDGLKDIECKVELVEEDRINLSERRKWGSIRFMIAEPNPHFLIHFEHTEVDGMLGKQEWYLFDGRWLHQAVERIEQITRQEMVRPGEKIDMFDLERAPFPLPFGQKKDTILKNFDVSLVPPAAGDPKGTDHLVCMPKPGSVMHRKYDKLEFFVSREVHLPVRVIATKNDGLEVLRADFPDLNNSSINAGVGKKDFTRPRAWKKYKEVIEPLPTERRNGSR